MQTRLVASGERHDIAIDSLSCPNRMDGVGVIPRQIQGSLQIGFALGLPVHQLADSSLRFLQG